MPRDAELVEFLQWALPRLRLRWAGMRRVRGQVRKRLARRVEHLGLADLPAYRHHLEACRDDDGEWAELDRLCRITISRFYRDRAVFDRLRELLPELQPLRCWSAGCASGEEPYTLALIAVMDELEIDIVATDADPHLLERARRGCYGDSSLRELPRGWRARLDDAIEFGVRFSCQDIRRQMPDGPFQLILCRNLVFTYFEESLQRELLGLLVDRLGPGGLLVVGTHERLPDHERRAAGIYRREQIAGS